MKSIYVGIFTDKAETPEVLQHEINKGRDEQARAHQSNVTKLSWPIPDIPIKMAEG